MKNSSMRIDPDLLKQKLIEKNLRHIDVANKLKINSKTVQRWVNGYVTRTNIETVRELTRILKCDLQEICQSLVVAEDRPTNAVLKTLLSPPTLRTFRNTEEYLILLDLLSKFKVDEISTSQFSEMRLAQGYFKYKLGRYRSARRFLNEAVTTAAATKNERTHLLASSYLGSVHKADGRYLQAEKILANSLRQALAFGDQAVIADIEYRRGSLYIAQGEFTLAEQTIKRSLLRELKLPRATTRGPALKYIQLARLAFRRLNLTLAKRYYERASKHASRRGSHHTEGVAHYALALIYYMQGDSKQAEQQLRRARLLFFEPEGQFTNQKLLQIEFIYALYDKRYDRAETILRARYKLNRHSPTLIVEVVKSAVLLERVSNGKFKCRATWRARADKYIQDFHLTYRAEQIKKIPAVKSVTFENIIQYLIL